MFENGVNRFKNDVGCGMGVRGDRVRAYRGEKLDKGSGRRGRGEACRKEQEERNKEKMKRRACVSTCL